MPSPIERETALGRVQLNVGELRCYHKCWMNLLPKLGAPTNDMQMSRGKLSGIVS